MYKSGPFSSVKKNISLFGGMKAQPQHDFVRWLAICQRFRTTSSSFCNAGLRSKDD